jgi:nucleotide-binding universal stress UspA family protein
MFKTIVVPLDGSKRAEAILPHVVEMGKCMNSQILLLQVIEPVLLPYEVHGYVPEMDARRTEEERTTAEDYLEDIARQFRQSGLTAFVRVEVGQVVETILEVCKIEGGQLIALASHGRTGLSRAFYGSIADGLLNRCTCPMLVVRSV